MKTFRLISVGFFVAVLSACGGGGGGSSSSTTPSSGVSGTYTASGTAGEVLSYTVDTVAKTYSYVITKSSYGLEGQTGSGTLTKNSDGSFTPSESPNSRVYALPNGLLLGGIKMTISGQTQHVPIIGVQNPLTSLADLAGTFNYVSNSCSAKAFGAPSWNGCNTNYGTVKINTDGTYSQCTQANITTSATCYNVNGSQGSLTSLGGGLFKYVKQGAASNSPYSYFMAFLASNGEKVIIGDLNDPVYYGYGQFVGSSQPAANLTNAQFSTQSTGTWYYHDLYSDSSHLTTSVTSGAHVISGGSFTNPDGSSGTTQINTPWAGLVTTTQAGQSGNINGVSILAGTGVYVWRNNSNQVYGYQIGVRQ